MKCNLVYRSPDGQEYACEVTRDLAIGRSPAEGGVVLTPEDRAISGTALVVAVREGHVVVRNASSFAQLDVQHQQGTRFLFPGEELAVRADVIVTIPGTVYSHVVHVQVEGAEDVNDPPTGTTPLVDEAFEVPAERRSALAGLCAARFFPDRFGSALLTATAIANLMTAAGEPVTAKAVNNKLQRLRTDIADKLGVYLDTREDLADWAIRQGHVSRGAVEALIDG